MVSVKWLSKVVVWQGISKLVKIPVISNLLRDVIYRVKTCNYISNVLMSKEALDAGLNFMVNITDDGFLGEGATENIAYLNKVVQISSDVSATSFKLWVNLKK